MSATATTIAPARGPRPETREAIRDAVERLLGRYGYKKMTIDDVAEEAGIGKGTVYLYFRSKEELVLSHIDRMVERILARLEEIAREPREAAERIREMLVERVMQRFDTVQHYTESLNDLLVAIRPSLLQRHEQHYALEAEIVARVLREGRRGGEFELRSPSETAALMMLATSALFPYSLSPEELGERSQVKRRADGVARLLLEGITRKK